MQQPPNVNVPPGYIEMLQEFTVSVLRSKPDDIIGYAADYFTRLKSNSVKLDLSNSTGIHNKPLNLQTTNTITDQNKSINTDNHQIETKIFQDEISPQINFNDKIEFSSSDSEEESSDLAPVIPVDMSRMRRKSVAAEPYNPDEMDDEEEEIYNESSLPKDQHDLLFNVCKKLVLFKSLDEMQLNRIISVMTSRVVTPGEKIIEQGEDGDNFYIIESGIFAVFVHDQDGENKNVFQYENEGSFGELALMYNAPRSATVQAKTEGRIWCMKRADFRKLVLNHASKQRRTFLNLLHSVTVLQDLSPYERMNLADALVSRVYKDQECIIKEGDPGTEMYFVMEGNVVITQHDENDANNEIKLAELTRGGYFGELALLSKSPRAASAFAKGETTIAVLDVDGFERLLGPCVDLLRRHSYRYSKASAENENKFVC